MSNPSSQPELDFDRMRETAAEPPREPRTVPLLSFRTLHLGRLGLVLLAIGIFWRILHWALAYPIWGDEGFVAVNFLARDWGGMLKPLEWGQIVSVGYMWIGLSATKLLGTSEWALRLPSLIFGIASLLIFWRFARKAVAIPAAVLALGFLAAAYYPVRHSAEVKPYALDLLVSTTFAILALEVRRRPDWLRGWLAIIVLAALGPWLSYPAAFVGGGVALFLAQQAYVHWLAAGKRTHATLKSRGQINPTKGKTREPASSSPTRSSVDRRFASIFSLGSLVFGCVLLGSFLSMYFVYGKGQADYSAKLISIDMWEKTFPPLTKPVEFVKWFLFMHTGNMLAYPIGGDKGASTLTFLLVIIGSIRLWRRDRALLLLLLAPLLLTFLAAAFKKYPYGGSARTSLYMAPAFCTLAGLGLWWTISFFVRRNYALLSVPVGGKKIVLDWGRGPLVRFAVFVLAVIAGAGAIASAASRGKSTPEQISRDAVTALRDRTRPNDCWVLFNSKDPVDYAPWLGDWQGTGGQFVFDIVRFAPCKIDWAPRPEFVAAEGGRVWLLSYRGVKVKFPEEQFAAYRARFVARFGEPSGERWLIKEKEKSEGKLEAFDIYQFP